MHGQQVKGNTGPNGAKQFKVQLRTRVRGHGHYLVHSGVGDEGVVPDGGPAQDGGGVG